MFTFDEAVYFLEETLKITNVERKAKEDKLNLLTEYTRKFPQCIPFQNLTLLSILPEERKLPSADDIKSEVGSGLGGLCFSIASFTCSLFSSLGFSTYLVGCSIPSTGKSFSHVACVAENVLQPDDCFLIETGAGFPSFEPISLTQLPIVFKHAFLEYKFVKKENIIYRYHRVGEHLGNLPSDVDSSGWQVFYQFELVKRTEEFLKPFQIPIYTQPGYAAGWYLKSLKMSLYPEGQAITLNNYVLKTWNEPSNQLITTEIKDDEQLSDIIKEYFPMLKNVNIQQAIKTINSYDKK